METLSVVRAEIQSLSEKVKDITVLKIIRNLLELELFEEQEMDLSFPEKLKQELDNRRETALKSATKVFTVTEVQEYTLSSKK